MFVNIQTKRNTSFYNRLLLRYPLENVLALQIKILRYQQKVENIHEQYFVAVIVRS